VTGLGIGIEAHGDDVASRHLTGLAKRGRDPRPAFTKIIEDLRAGEAKWFASSGEGSWPKLAEATLADKARNGYPAQTLVRSGALLASLTAARGKQGRRTATTKQMRFGSRVFYARFHQTGSGVPRRPPLVPTDQRTRRKMVGDVRSHLLGRGTREAIG
jgi:hypothetical protein